MLGALRLDEDQLDDEVWTNPILHDRMLRRKQLQRDKYLVDKIKHRDRNLCRYCGIRVNWLDRNGPTGGTYDHIDPDGVNSIANVVVACRRCNGIKKDRTPDQAEMSLFDPGTDASAVAAHVARTSANATPAPAGASRKPGSGLAAPREHARDVPELGPNQAASGRSRSDQVALDRDELQPHPPNARPQAGTADSIEESQRPCTTRLRVRSPNEPGTCSSKT